MAKSYTAEFKVVIRVQFEDDEELDLIDQTYANLEGMIDRFTVLKIDYVDGSLNEQ